MLIKGEAISGIWTLRFSAHQADDVWSIEVRTPYGKMLAAETRAPLPFEHLNHLLGEGFDGCGRTSASQRPPRPALRGRRQQPKPNLRLGPRRPVTATNGALPNDQETATN